jgi:hypothetical protein
MGDSEKMDMGALSERELLILLNYKVQSLTDSLDKLNREYIDLYVKVAKIETRHKVNSAFWGIATVIISILINLLNVFKK